MLDSLLGVVGLGAGPRADAPEVDASKYQWGGKAGAAEAEQGRLTGFEDQQRALALGARGQQAGLAGQYADMAAGKGPSLAGQQMTAGLQQAQGQQQAMAAATRGGAGNALLAQRAAQRSGQEMAAGVVRDQGMARVQEQLGAMQGQAGLLGQMRGADMQGYQADMGAKYGIAGQQLGAGMAQDKARMDASMWEQQQNMAAEQAAQARRAAMIQSVMKGGAAAMSGGMAGLCLLPAIPRTKAAPSFFKPTTAPRRAWPPGRRRCCRRARSTAPTRAPGRWPRTTRGA